MNAVMLEPVERTMSVRERLSTPELRVLVERFVRKRVPEVEVDDLVQTVLMHALASTQAPDGEGELRGWLIGITRHKVADFHRKRGRHQLVELPDQLADGGNDAQTAREWVDWAEQQAADNPEAQRTLDWMAREGAGEKLAHIARDEQVHPTQVRQRVSRMRRFMKQRWAAELAAVAAIVVVAIVAWRLLREPEPIAVPEPHLVPDVIPDVIPGPPKLAPALDRARALRAEAEKACQSADYQGCIDKLDEAAGLDPDGDTTDAVRTLREQAERALAPPELEPTERVPNVPGPTERTPSVPAPSTSQTSPPSPRSKETSSKRKPTDKDPSSDPDMKQQAPPQPSPKPPTTLPQFPDKRGPSSSMSTPSGL